MVLNWKVDVVDKDDKLFAKGRPVHSLPSLVQLAHDHVLSVDRLGDPGEEERGAGKLLLVQLNKYVLGKFEWCSFLGAQAYFTIVHDRQIKCLYLGRKFTFSLLCIYVY